MRGPTMTKRAGMQAAASGVPPEWLAEAEALVLEIAHRGTPFTGNDVWDAGLSDPEHGSRRALGVVLYSLSRRGIIVPTGRFLPATNRRQHEQPIREWRSVLTRPQREWRAPQAS